MGCSPQLQDSGISVFGFASGPARQFSAAHRRVSNKISGIRMPSVAPISSRCNFATFSTF
jgi:hypothetical protein